MKINVKTTALAIGYALFHAQNLSASFNNDIDNDDFIKQIHNLENNIHSVFNDFYNKTFQEVGNPTNHSTDFIDQQSLTDKNRSVRYFQQSTNSMSFANKDKAIKIIEQKTEKTKIYTIHVTDKKPEQSNVASQKNDTTAKLKALQAYIQKNFHAPQAIHILQECLDTIEHEDANKSITIEASAEDNQQKFIIKIDSKENAASNSETSNDKKHKNKKSNRFTPRAKQ